MFCSLIKRRKRPEKDLNFPAAENETGKKQMQKLFWNMQKRRRILRKAAQDAGKIYKEVTFDSASIKPDKKLVKAADELSKGDLTDCGLRQKRDVM